MGQHAFNWLRPFRSRQGRKQLHQQPPGSASSSPPHTPLHSHLTSSRRSSSNPDFEDISQPSSSVPFYNTSYPLVADLHQFPEKAPRRQRKSPSMSASSPPQSQPPQPPRRLVYQRRNSTQITQAAKRLPPFPQANGVDGVHQPMSLDFVRMPDQNFPSEYGNDARTSSIEVSARNSVASALDSFVPHRPADREPAFVPPLASDLAAQAQMRFSATTPEVSSVDRMIIGRGLETEHSAGAEEPPHGRYHTTMRHTQPSRFIFRRRTRSNHAAAQPPGHVEDEYFGTTQHDDHSKNSDLGQGEEVLLRFLRKTLGPKSHNLAVRLMNKSPITSTTSFSYVIHQGTEDSDLDIIRRDLTSGRLYSSGVRLIGGAWCNLLLGDRFTPGASTRQRHELTYRRSACSCITCRLRAIETLREREHNGESDLDSNAYSAEILTTMSSTSRTPTHSAMANFVVKHRLPSPAALKLIGGSSSTKELEIGTVVRLNYRASAKLRFTEDVRELFGHFAYTGPISHEEVYRRVTTIGVHYYLYNKGKKERKVYIQGELIRLPVQVGVVKLGTQPMFVDELGATFCMHRKQIMSIYVGEIVLEGNSLGSFIKTGIPYYIGFGEERGVCPVYPNKTIGKARKLGINELLLHHHMVDDLEVRCI